VAAAVLSLFVTGLAAQNNSGAGSAAPKKWCSGCSADGKTTPRTKDGHPDLSGFYNWSSERYVGDPTDQTSGHSITRSEDGSITFLYGGSGAGGGEGAAPRPTAVSQSLADITCQRCENPPYKPEYMEQVKQIADEMAGNASPRDPQYDCKPLGIPRGALRGSNDASMQIVQNADVIAFLYESRPGPYFRVVYMDGRPHPERLDESYFGHSIGHWEGDTLVVDVVGLNDETWLGSGTVGPRFAMMHSNQLHVVERWTRNGDTLTYEATVEDPVMFTKPWVTTPRTTQIAPGDYIQPTMCVGLDKEHLIKSDGTPYSGPAATAAPATPAAVIGGSWNVSIHSTTQGLLSQQWTLRQDGATITGTARSNGRELPLEGALDGASLRVTVTDGPNKHEFRGAMSGEEMDGTIRMGNLVFRLSAKRAQ
jgi:hypothetical protein